MWQFVFDENHFYDLRELPIGNWEASKIKMKKNSIWMQFENPEKQIIYNSSKPIDFDKKYVPPKRSKSVTRNIPKVQSKNDFVLSQESLFYMNEENQILGPNIIIPTSDWNSSPHQPNTRLKRYATDQDGTNLYSKNSDNVTSPTTKQFKKSTGKNKLIRRSLQETAVIPTRHPYHHEVLPPHELTLSITEMDDNDIPPAPQIVRRSIGSDSYKNPYRISHLEIRKQFRESIDENFHRKRRTKQKFNSVSRIPNIKSLAH